jgi:hypothetical protein
MHRLPRQQGGSSVRRAGQRDVADYLRSLRRIRTERAERLGTAAVEAAKAQRVAVPGEHRAAAMAKEIAVEALAARERTAALDAEIRMKSTKPFALTSERIGASGPRYGYLFDGLGSVMPPVRWSIPTPTSPTGRPPPPSGPWPTRGGSPEPTSILRPACTTWAPGTTTPTAEVNPNRIRVDPAQQQLSLKIPTSMLMMTQSTGLIGPD